MNPQEKAQCVERFVETKSDAQDQRRFRTTYHKTLPWRPSTRAWYRQFKKVGSDLHKKDAGPLSWPSRSPDIIRYDFFLWGYAKECVYQTPVSTSTIWRKEQKLLLQHSMLTWCSTHGWSLYIAWTLYVWQMVPVLNVTLRVSLTDGAHSIRLRGYIQKFPDGPPGAGPTNGTAVCH